MHQRREHAVAVGHIAGVCRAFGGQAFMEEMLPKIRQARSLIGNRPIWLQVDGGISLETIERAAEAGADTFVAGSAVFNSENPEMMVQALREKARIEL